MNYYNILQSKYNTKIYYTKTLENAIIPTKAHNTDTGYDLVCINKVKNINEHTIMYDTGITIQPPEGYYTEIVPRSSIIKSGYILTNSIGIIDCSYTGSLKICLTRLDNNIKEPELPFCLTQLIIRKRYNLEFECKDKLDETERGEGGFGSTN